MAVILLAPVVRFYLLPEPRRNEPHSGPERELVRRASWVWRIMR